MATVVKRVSKTGIVSYRAQVRITGHRSMSATFERRADAVRWGAATEHAILSGEALPGEELPLNDRSMGDAIDAYLDLTERMPRRSRHTILTDRDTGRRLRTAFAGHSLRSLTREDIEEYRDRRLQIVGPSSVRQDLSMLSRIYETARISWRTSIPFPGANVKLPAPPPNRKLILHADQIGALLTECQVSKNPSLYPLVLLLLSTGMRPEEAVLLEWSRVDLERSTVYLHETKTEPRTVPIPDDVLQVLASMPRSGRMVFIADEIAGRPKPTRYFRRSFELACVRARINQPLRRDGRRNAPASSPTPRVTMYTLRHSAATYLLMHGTDIRTVADILGHGNIGMTMKYTHMVDSHKLAAVSNPNLPWMKKGDK